MKVYRAYSPSRDMSTSPVADKQAAQGMAATMNQGAVALGQEQDWIVQVAVAEWKDLA